MNRPAARREGPNPLEWIETATHLLRSAPAGALLCYYTGSTTCLLGLLYFWTDMSRGAFAAGHLIESALSAAALYIWMKCWQAAFFSKLRAHLLMEPEEPWTLRRIARLVAAQAAFQPVGLFLRFIAANILIPYIWTYSLFMGAAILGDGTNPSLHAVARGAVREAGLWWRQTHLALLGLFGFAMFILLNIIVVAIMLPFALRTFLGVESPFTRDPWSMVNSTFLAVTLAVTYLCFDPLRKAVFLVRHFQGSSIQSGEDLSVALKSISSRSRAAVAALVLLGALLATPLTPLRADEPAPPPRVESTKLNDSLDRVLERREYEWRFPRAVTDESEHKGWLASFIEGVGKKIAEEIKSTWKKVRDWMDRVFKSKKDDSDVSSGGIEWSLMANLVWIVLIVALVALLGMLLWRSSIFRRVVVSAEPVAIVPDLNEESVTAD